MARRFDDEKTVLPLRMITKLNNLMTFSNEELGRTISMSDGKRRRSLVRGERHM